METIEIKIKPLMHDLILPDQSTEHSAGFDAHVPVITKLKFGRQIIPLGFSVEMPPTLSLDARPRSGYSAKGLLVTDEDGFEFRIDADVTLGLIDADYRGQVGAIVHVRSWRVWLSHYLPWLVAPLYILPGQAICQLCFREVPQVKLVKAEELSETNRGTKGFGGADNE